VILIFVDCYRQYSAKIKSNYQKNENATSVLLPADAILLLAR